MSPHRPSPRHPSPHRPSLRRRALAAGAGAALLLTAPLLTAPLLTASARPQAAASSPLVARPQAAASSPLVITGGLTLLVLQPSTSAVLTTNGVAVGLVAEARATRSGIRFPITGGIVTPGIVGTIDHVGGLTFTLGNRTLTVRDFVVDTRTDRLTAYVDQTKATIPLLDLDLRAAPITAAGSVVTVAGVGAKLDRAGARTLNGYLTTRLFTGGLAFGTVTVQASILTS